MFLYVIFSFYFSLTSIAKADIITLIYFFCNNISTVKTEKLSTKVSFKGLFSRIIFFTNHDYKESER